MSQGPRASLRDVAREWTRIGVTGFGGPPTHIALLRRLVVERRGWIGDRDFEDALAVCNLLPGPASTQLAILCAMRAAGRAGALVAGLGFIVPSVAIIIALSALFLAHAAPDWVRGAGAGSGAAVAAVALSTGLALLRPGFGRVRATGRARARWAAYVIVGAVAGATIGPYLVIVLICCGLVEVAVWFSSEVQLRLLGAPLALGVAGSGGLSALAWVAFKVGALSFGGGFVIVPLMRGDAIHTYHWMTSAQFLSAVALGQVTPGPVVATVAAIGYAARGIGGALLAATVAFLPSFAFVMLGGGHFEQLRSNRRARAFLAGAGPAAIGAILGAALPLAAALHDTWQFFVLGAAALSLLVARRGIVLTLVAAGAVGVVVALVGGPV